MNTPHKRLAKIGSVIIAILAMYFYTEYGIEILFAVTVALLVDYISSRSRIYKSLKGLQIAKEKFHRYMLKRDLKKAIEKERSDEYAKIIIENALEKVKSIDENDRKVGLAQLQQFGVEDTYKKLLDILKNNEFDEIHEKQIVETLCKVLNGYRYK